MLDDRLNGFAAMQNTTLAHFATPV